MILGRLLRVIFESSEDIRRIVQRQTGLAILTHLARFDEHIVVFDMMTLLTGMVEGNCQTRIFTHSPKECVFQDDSLQFVRSGICGGSKLPSINYCL